MEERIPLPTVGEILSEEFMKPYNLSAYRLAKEIGVPTSRVQDILHGRRRISVDTAIRLSRFFRMSDNFFINIQSDIEMREVKRKVAAELDAIRPIELATA